MHDNNKNITKCARCTVDVLDFPLELRFVNNVCVAVREERRHAVKPKPLFLDLFLQNPHLRKDVCLLFSAGVHLLHRLQKGRGGRTGGGLRRVSRGTSGRSAHADKIIYSLLLYLHNCAFK